MTDRITAWWSKSDARRAVVYSVAAIGGLAIGAVWFARSRPRSKILQQEGHPESNHPGPDFKKSTGRPEQRRAMADNDHVVSHADLHAPAIAPAARSLPFTQTELLPTPVGARPSNKKNERQMEQELLLDAETSQGLKCSDRSSAAATQNRWQYWIQTGCAILILISIVVFGATLARRLTALINAQRDSQSTALAAQQLSRTEQRAWVGMMDAVPMPLRSDGGGFAVKMQNTGWTPAFDVRFSAVITLAGNDTLMEAEGRGAATTFGILLPGEAYQTEVSFRTSPEAVKALVKHTQRAVGWLWMNYTDVFGTPHSSRSCFYWYPDLKSVKPCEAFNEMK